MLTDSNNLLFLSELEPLAPRFYSLTRHHSKHLLLNAAARLGPVRFELPC
jgi:hypothetical protein